MTDPQSAFHFAFGNTNRTEDEEKRDLLAMSHGVAVILLFLYIAFMLFQMWTHAHLYEDDKNATTSTRYRPEIAGLPGRARAKVRRVRNFRAKKTDEETADASSETKSGMETKETASTSEATAPESNGALRSDGGSTHSSESEEEEEIPQMNVPVTIIVMIIIAVLVGVTAEFLVDSINGMVASNPSLSAEWVGLILLPIVGEC